MTWFCNSIQFVRLLNSQILPPIIFTNYFNFIFILKMSTIEILFLLLLPSFANFESIEEDQGDPYYGVPLGALHYSAEGTSAEVYAADEFSIIFNHFHHNPRESGCTAMMIGPPRPEDKENVVPGHGLILPLAHSPVTARHRARRRRSVANGKRGEQFQGYWPVEFDHLLMGPTDGEDGLKKGKEGRGKVKKEENSKNNDGKEQMAVLNRVSLNLSVTDQLLLGNSYNWAQDPNSIPMASTFLPSSTIETSNSSVEAISTKSSSTPPQMMQETTNVPSSSPNTSKSSLIPPTQPSQPLILLGGKRASHQQQIDKAAEMNSDYEESLIRMNSNAEIRRAPARHNAANLEKANELDEKGILATSLSGATTTISSSEKNGQRTISQPRFWVINDPRAARRQRLIELRKKLDPNYVPPTTSTTAAPFSPLEAQFELPRIRDKLATFALTNGAKITQYKWIGLWNQCTKRHIPLVSLRDVDPPREEKIMPLSGWSHNVTSYRLHILNCNTILIPSFHYDGRNTTKNTYFFTGVGQFPEAVEQQIKTNVIGQRKGEPLRSYTGEDVLLRLPRPYRTFDIDFISIFNTDEQKSFGHVLIPSLLVPPCPEDDD